MTNATPRPRHVTRLLCAAVAFSTLAVPAAVHAARGVQDSFGYSWADSDEPGVSITPPAYTVQTNLRTAGLTGDNAVIAHALPLTVFPTGFTYYGQSYGTVYISTNGWMSFVNPGVDSAPTVVGLGNTSVPNGALAFYWDDLTMETSPALAPGADAGPNVAGDGYTFRIRAKSVIIPSAVSEFYVTLYRTGGIKFFYTTGATNGVFSNTLTIGIESGSGLIGNPYMETGLPLSGARFADNYAVQYFPPPMLNCTAGVSAITCPMSAAPFSNATGSNNVSVYNCSPGTFNGNEKVFSVTLAELSDVNVTLVNTDGRSRSLFFMMPTCNEQNGCMQGGTTSAALTYLPPGTYYIVVDGTTGADNGNFTLDVQCAPVGVPIACNSTLISQSVSGPSRLDTWSCAGAMSGSEKTYKVTTTQPVTLRATLSNQSDPNLTLLLSDAAGLTPPNPTCTAASTTSVTAWGAAPGTYYVTVDHPNRTGDSFDISVECRRDLVCPSPANPIDVASRLTVFGDTSVTGQTNVDTYYCTESATGQGGVTTGYTGPEDVYEFTITTPQTVGFTLTSDANLRVLLLGNCYEGSCIHEGGCSESLQPGTYTVVVDGVGGAQGAYALTPFSSPTATYNRWYQCPEQPNIAGQSPLDIQRTRWGFTDNTFCGTGCDFSMFAVVECGTEFHIPFWDVETGRMRIFDVLNQQPVTITATNDLPTNGLPRFPCTSWMTTTGTYVEWLDRGCPAGGNDCQTNNVVQDVSFSGTPTVCGVYRLDFIDWGGYVWDVYANCTRDRTEQYYIARDLCSAMANYHPRPEVGFVAGTFTRDVSQCGSLIAQGTIDVQNIGCVPAVNFPVVIEQAPPAPPNPQTTLLNLASGQRTTFNWNYTLSVLPGDLIFRIDPGNTVRECSESLGSVVSCGTNSTLIRTSPQTTCPNQCTTTPNPGTAQQICEGAGTRLDGSGSVFRCVAGTPAYRWEDASNQPLPGCDWSASATCDVLPAALPLGTNVFTLRTRCTGDAPACDSSASVLVDVISNAAPPTLGNVLRINRAAFDLNLAWASILGVPVSAYRVYYSEDPQLRPLPAGNRTLLVEVPSNATTASHPGAVTLPEPLLFYQIVGVSCLGNVEGPY